MSQAGVDLSIGNQLSLKVISWQLHPQAAGVDEPAPLQCALKETDW